MPKNVPSPPAQDSSPFTKVMLVSVETDFDGQRIDNFLLARLKGVPKSVIYRCLRKGEVRVNKGRIKPEYRVKAGDEVRIPPLRRSETPEGPVINDKARLQLQTAILFEDESLIVLNKPAGFAVHGGSGVSWGVIEALRSMRPDARQLELVHRIDRETSGILLIAKKRARLRALHEQFQSGEISKEYWALVEGRWKKGVTDIQAPLHKFTDTSGERFVKVSEQGKPSHTRFRILKTFSDASLVEARPLTGRTHQIRVHCQWAGHAILGDEKYQSRESLKRFREKGAERMFLHARAIEFLDQTGVRIRFEAPLDAPTTRFLDVLASAEVR